MSIMKPNPLPAEYALNAVVYARYSHGPNQSDNSIDFQLRACHEYCAQKGFTCINDYIDRSVSGTTDKRPAFQQMITDAKQRHFGFVIVYRFDRFSRDRFDSAVYKKQLRDCGVVVLSTEESIGTGDESVILESIYEAMAESYSRRLSHVVTQGMLQKARGGFSTGGNTPYGYKYVDHKLVVDLRAAPAVRLVYELYASGTPKKIICDKLNAKGYKTQNGNPFTINFVDHLLSNTVYTGYRTYMDVVVPNPPIVDKELFDRVSVLLAQNRRTRGHKVTRVNFLLSGKLFCGKCGASMIGDGGYNHAGERYNYYTCARRKKSHSCDKKTVRKDDIEDYICRQTISFISAPDLRKKIARNVVALSKDTYGSDRKKQLEKEIDGLEKEIERAIDALIANPTPEVSARVSKRVETLEAQKNDLSGELMKLTANSALSITEEDVYEYLAGFCHGDLDDEDFRAELINTLVNAVFVFDDKIVVYYNIKTQNQVTYQKMLSDLSAASSDCSDCCAVAPPPKEQFEQISIFYEKLLFFVCF